MIVANTGRDRDLLTNRYAQSRKRSPWEARSRAILEPESRANSHSKGEYRERLSSDTQTKMDARFLHFRKDGFTRKRDEAAAYS